MKNISYKQKIYGRVSSKPYNAQFVYNNTTYYCGCYSTEREARVALDKKRLGLGLEPMYLKRLSIN